MEIIVGESIVLPCQIAHDPALDVSFSWAFNGQLVDFDRDGDHFERVGGVSHTLVEWAIFVYCHSISELLCHAVFDIGEDFFSPVLFFRYFL